MFDDSAKDLQARRIVRGEDFSRFERCSSGVDDQLRDPGPDEVYYRRGVVKRVMAVTGARGRAVALAPEIAEESHQ